MRLIDPKMSIDTIKSYIVVWDCKGCLPYGETQHNVMAVDDLVYLPTIEAEPVRHGRWIALDGWFNKSIVKCSVCGNTLNMDGVNAGRGDANFCPNCGSRMDGGEQNVLDQ